MIDDFERCYRAVCSRDARFDGCFVVGVLSTGIYCRPSCPARTPLRRNVRFFAGAAAAQRAGLRACRRCRPDAVPGSPDADVRADVVGRALRLIADGVVDREGVSGLARRLGYSERHLQRLLVAEVGASALAEWNLPESFTRAVAQHHHPPREVLGSLGRVLAAGETLAQLLDDTFPYEPVVDVAEALRNVGLTSRSVDQLHAEMRAEIERLGSFLRVHA